MVTVEHDGLTVETNTGTEAEVRAAMEMPSAEEPATDSPPAVTDNTPDAAETQESDSASQTDKTPSKNKPRDNLYARLSEATQKRKDAEQRIAHLEARLNEAQRPVEPAAQPARPAQTAPPAVAKVEYPAHLTGYDAFLGTFPDASYEDFTDARGDFRRDQAVKLPDVRSLVQQEWAQMQGVQAHSQRMDAAREKYGEAAFTAALEAGDQAFQAAGMPDGFSPAVIEAITSSKRSGDVVFYLGTHPDECVQLARETTGLALEAAPFIRSVLEMRLGAGVQHGAAPTPPLSNAKAPIKPLGSSPVAVPASDSDDEPLENYIARANAQDRKAGRL